jgi:hypothetical protein
VGLAVDLEDARAVLDEAAEWAESTRPVPDEWVDWTRRVDASPSKTFTVALGTALLAKATNPGVDALALKATSGPDAYSARAVAHQVLVPGALQHVYNLRATGREPLNNQPFFRYDRIDEIERIHTNARPHLPALIAACQAINQLDASGALAGLAAFLRVRMDAARERHAIDLRGAGPSLVQLIATTESFVTSDPEGGRRGQACVAAAFDLASATVHSGRINDPSRRMPGDVQVLEAGVPVLAVEVRQKEVNYYEAIQFAESLRRAEVATGLVAMLDPAQPELDEYDLLVDAERLHGVALTVAYGVQDVLLAAAVWCGKPLEDVLERFPSLMLDRLDQIDVAPATRQQWASLFA